MKPEISVITLVKNNSAGLENTLDSMLSQTFTNWECLIISAKSQDDTQSVADAMARTDSRIVHHHETAQGIYQSMNQGIFLANAPYIIFMNSGDIFGFTHAMDVLRKEIVAEKHSVVVGGYSTGGVIYSFNPMEFGSKRFSLNRRWGCHQSMIFNKHEILSQGGFSPKYKISSDFDLVLKLVGTSRGKRIGEVISVIEPDGISSTQILEVLREKQQIRKSYFGTFSPNTLFGYFWTFAVRLKIESRKLGTKFS